MLGLNFTSLFNPDPWIERIFTSMNLFLTVQASDAQGTLLGSLEENIHDSRP
jgi:hypothetical protein